MPFIISVSEVRAVSRMTGMWQVVRFSFINWQHLKPSITGMMISVIIKSGTPSHAF